MHDNRGTNVPNQKTVPPMKTSKKDKYLMGCLYAISNLLDDGSTSFAVEVDGKWETIPWSEICDWIDKQMEG